MAIRKRQLVLAALVVALGAAVYLNWQFGGNSKIVDAGTSVSDKELGCTAGKRFCGFFTVIGSIGGCVKCRFGKRCQRLLQKRPIRIQM
ncbi:MAG: hypothetical protein ACLRRA_09410 [Acutalibacteraceae bacterium]